MISTYLLGAAAALGLVTATAHADYRAAGNPGGVLSADQARLLRNVLAVATIVAACVGGSLRVGEF